MARDVFLIIIGLMAFIGLMGAFYEVPLFETDIFVLGNGTPGFLPVWESEKRLTDSSIKQDILGTWIPTDVYIGGSIVEVLGQNITGNVIPSLNNSFTIGNSSRVWSNVFTNNIILSDGSASSPALTFSNDSTAGLFRSSGQFNLRSGSSNKIGIFGSGGRQRAYISGGSSMTTFGAGSGNKVSLASSGSQNAYIITNSTTRLTITGAGRFGLRTENTANGVVQIQTDAGVNNGVAFVLSSNSGTNSSSYSTLDFRVPTTGLIGQFFATANNYVHPQGNLDANSLGLSAVTGQLSLRANDATLGNINFVTNQTERIRILNSGFVGFGTSFPNRVVHINDTLRIEPRSSAPASPSLGDLYVDSDSNELCFYNSTAWVGISGGGACS